MLSIWSESFPAKAEMSAASTSCCNSYGLLGWSTVVLAVADDTVLALSLLTNWCYTNIIIEMRGKA